MITMSMFLKQFGIMCSQVKRSILHSDVKLSQYTLRSNRQYCNFPRKSFYTVLGVKPEATEEQIKEAYYSQSKKYHPDLNIGNKNAETKILEINEAFEVLGNKATKEKYDDKMFPKVWEKHSFIYDHEPKTEPQDFIFRRSFKKMSSAYELHLKHTRGIAKKKHRHAVQKQLYHKSQSTQKLSKTFFKS